MSGEQLMMKRITMATLVCFLTMINLSCNKPKAESEARLDTPSLDYSPQYRTQVRTTGGHIIDIHDSHVFLRYHNQVLVDGKIVEIQNGLDLSGQDLRGIRIWLEGGETGDQVLLKNVNFSGNYLARAELFDTIFIDCGFCETDLNNSILYGGNTTIGEGCDFTNAEIVGASIQLTSKQLQSTGSYKRKSLCDVKLHFADYRGVSFAGFNLRNSRFYVCRLIDCDFTDASIEGMQVEATPGFPPNDKYRRGQLEGRRHLDIKIEQLLATADFKKGIVTNVRIDRLAWPDHVVNLSNMVFVGCTFGMGDKPAKIDLTNSVISNCNFRDLNGLTLDNVKSTWNYQHGRMEGILLPEEIQEALENEL